MRLRVEICATFFPSPLPTIRWCHAHVMMITRVVVMALVGGRSGSSFLSLMYIHCSLDCYGAPPDNAIHALYVKRNVSWCRCFFFLLLLLFFWC
jgi:hypothetical protein